ncbi:hypothetical protein TNCV_3166571 [Trichonephila clavipes]|uniref:Uncharacterized protein n=1 Tax=Trichonephila clavipes TaxID=2585209 RepID=A0A8X6USH3_TRICX|nr:hypothetical protein TNCV_3166571 [Trichonephila clavipes]
MPPVEFTAPGRGPVCLDLEPPLRPNTINHHKAEVDRTGRGFNGTEAPNNTLAPSQWPLIVNNDQVARKTPELDSFTKIPR